MRSNSGLGKSNNNLRDPTMKELEEMRRKSSDARGGDLQRAGSDTAGRRRSADAEPIDKS